MAQAPRSVILPLDLSSTVLSTLRRGRLTTSARLVREPPPPHSSRPGGESGSYQLIAIRTGQANVIKGS